MVVSECLDTLAWLLVKAIPNPKFEETYVLEMVSTECYLSLKLILNNHKWWKYLSVNAIPNPNFQETYELLMTLSECYP